jgi:hypothetical protein
MWLRVGTGDGLDSCGSGQGLAADWIHVAQDRDWRRTGFMWLRIGTGDGLDSCDSE